MLFICLRMSGAYKRERAMRVTGTVIITLFLLVACSLQITYSSQDFYDGKAELGDLKSYSGMASHETYLIPTNPLACMYRSPDCQIQNGNIEKSDHIEMDLDTQYAVSLYVHRDTWENQISLPAYYVSVYDRDGGLAATVPQISDAEEEYVGFDLDMPVNGISRLEFTHEDGSPAYVAGMYLIGYR